MSHAKAIFIIDGPKGKSADVNGARPLRKMLLVDPYVDDLNFQLEYFCNAECIAIGNGVIAALK